MSTALFRLQEIESLIAREAASQGYPVPATAAHAMAVHLAMTLRWARVAGLTAIRSADAAVRRHVMESVAAAARVDPSLGPLLDIGSGNGYPALPIKCMNPSIRATLLEPALRKWVFLRQVVSSLSLDQVEVRRERVMRGSDLDRYAPLGTISMRGVAVVGAILGGAPSALVRGGRLVLLIGESTAREALASLPGALAVKEHVTLPGRRSASLLIVEKR